VAAILYFYHRMSKLYILFGIFCTIQIILAKICGPYSCEWGNKTYFWSGIIIVIASFLIPFLQQGIPVGKQLGLGFLFIILSAGLWIAGFLLGSFRIICTLF
jgi:hypothetical protein